MNAADTVRKALSEYNFELVFNTLNALNLRGKDENLHDMILLVEAQYSKYKKEKNQGILSHEQDRISDSRLFISIIDIANRLQNLKSNESKFDISYPNDESQSPSIIKFSEIRKYYEINNFQVANYKKVNEYIKKLLSSHLFEDNWQNDFLAEFKKKTESLSKIHSVIIKTNFITDKESPNWYKMDIDTRNYTKKLIERILNQMEYWEIDDYLFELEKYYNVLSGQIEQNNKEREATDKSFQGAFYIILFSIGVVMYYFWGLLWSVLGVFVLVALIVLIPPLIRRY